MAILVLLPALAFAAEPADLPPGASQDWWSQVQQTIRAEEYEFSRLAPEAGTGAADSGGERAVVFTAPNRAQGFQSELSVAGPRVTPQRSEAEPPGAVICS